MTDTVPSPRADRRQRILEAAVPLFAAHGYAATSTARICHAAGVSSGTFFHHFPTKTALVAALLREDRERADRHRSRLRELARTDALAALDAWCAGILAEAADPDLPGFVAMLSQVPEDPAVSAALAEEADGDRETRLALIRAARAQGAVEADAPAEDLAAWLGVLADGVLTRAADRSAEPPAGLAELVRRIVAARD